jgi:hypothetical protein
MQTTTRWGIRYPEGTDSPDVPLWMGRLASDLDDVAKDDQGLLAARPTSTAVSAGKPGRYYYATDTAQLFRDMGTSWTEVALTEASAVQLGLTTSTGTRRGVSMIATEEARTNTAYGLLATPDRVQNVVLPADGLLFVAYQAMWKESVSGAGRAALCLNGTPVGRANAGVAAPVTEGGVSGVGPEAATGGVATDTYKPLASHPGGLCGIASTATAYTGDLTTGQLVGTRDTIAPTDQDKLGIATIFAAAGTYDVSVQFKASSGSVTAKDRKLWVWTMGF